MTTVHGRRRAPKLPITYGRFTDFADDPIACMRELLAEHGDLAVLEENGQRLVFVFGQEWNQRVLT
ncbi:MAG: hypothetical protein IH898_14345, partial [Planctomycetes bacterium]|nr:hypothetical protein [Planctomycetota bacterium]